jgi:hypothetical protein
VSREEGVSAVGWLALAVIVVIVVVALIVVGM